MFDEYRAYTFVLDTVSIIVSRTYRLFDIKVSNAEKVRAKAIKEDNESIDIAYTKRYIAQEYV